MPYTLTKDDYTEGQTRKPCLQVRADVRTKTELAELADRLLTYSDYLSASETPQLRKPKEESDGK